MIDPVITTRNLAIGYGTKHVLKEINVTLSPGKLVCFMGPNGSGKSTLLRTLTGYHAALKGEVYLKEKPITAYSRTEKSALFSLVLTGRVQSEYMTGRQLVALGRLPHTNWAAKMNSADAQAIEKALDATGSTSYADAWLFELSDGQQQKLAIARALAQETPIIILDEPTAHLDLNNRLSIINLLRNLAHEAGHTILMATHELDLALQRADELWLADPLHSVITGMPEDLVLNGEIDQVFQFKGYDLKTGLVDPPTAQTKVKLEGDGAIWLWTKNALERNSIGVDPNARVKITVPKSSEELQWHQGEHSFSTISDLITHLQAK